MDEEKTRIELLDLMKEPEGWGRAQGREVYTKLLNFVDSRPDVVVFELSAKGIRRFDVSFAMEALVEVARRHRGSKGFCFVDLEDADIIENVGAAGMKKRQPFTIWTEGGPKIVGFLPNHGYREALAFALARPHFRSADFAAAADMPLPNAGIKFKKLWEEGFVLRRAGVAWRGGDVQERGGVEYVYRRIG
jgi:hypothetical protein